MNLKSLRQLAAMAALLGTMAPALAGSLAFDAPQGTRNGLQSDASSGPPLSASYFVGATGGIVTSIVWWGYHGANSGGESFDNFAVWLDGAQQSGSLTKTAVSDFTRYELDIADIAVQAMQSGDLEILNDSFDVEWFWQYANTDNPQMSFSLDSNPRTVSVPEPGSLALAGLALLGLTSSARRRTR